MEESLLTQEVFDALSEPFEPYLIEWKPQAVAKDGLTALAAAYADPRAYIDRLNEVVGSEWSDKYDAYDNGRVVLYLDGAPAEIHDIGLLDLWPLQTGDDLDVRIGQGLNGALDDLRIYDRPLSEGEIRALFELKTDRLLSEIK